MNTETMKDPIVEFIALAEQIRELCPCPDKDCGKYVAFTVSGYEPFTSATVYFGEGARWEVSSMAELREKVDSYDPVEERRRQIEHAKAELARLQDDLAKLEAA